MAGNVVKLAVSTAVIAFALFAIFAFFQDLDATVGPHFSVWERVGLLLLALLAIGVVVAAVAGRQPAAYVATLLGTALWVPWTAALASSAIYLADIQGNAFWQDNALLIGSGFAGALWLLYPLIDRDYPTAHRQSPGWYGLLRDSVMELKTRADLSERGALCLDPKVETHARRQITTTLDAVLEGLERPGLQWVTRSGFNQAWTAYHHAEEAMIQVAARESVIDVAVGDILRLDGATIRGGGGLQTDLRMALAELDPKADAYVAALLPAPVTATTAVPPATSDPCGPLAALKRCLTALVRKPEPVANDPTGPAKAEAAVSCQADQRARTVIQTIHRALNTYRGSRWADLGRARWQLVLTTTVAGMFAFLALALALIRGMETTPFVTAWAYFLIGAIAGLFLRLYLASREFQVSDDYGLEAARLYQTPLLSGMAAVIGVVLMASVAGSSLGDVLMPGTGDAEATVAVASESPTASASASAAASPAVSASPAASLAAASPAPSASPAVAACTCPDADAGGQSTMATLGDAFDLTRYPIGIVIALAFGLTPNLVLRRLGVVASEAKRELAASRPT